MAKAYREGLAWAIRRRYKGNDIYLSGYEKKEDVEQAASDRVSEIKQFGAPKRRETYLKSGGEDLGGFQ